MQKLLIRPFVGHLFKLSSYIFVDQFASHLRPYASILLLSSPSFVTNLLIQETLYSPKANGF